MEDITEYLRGEDLDCLVPRDDSVGVNEACLVAQSVVEFQPAKYHLYLRIYILKILLKWHLQPLPVLWT